MFLFPYSNIHELNLDWLLQQMIELKKQTADFININSIKYADPLQWRITTQYEANTVVINPEDSTAYLSVQPVPAGVNITNTEYWTPIGNFAELYTDIKKSIAAPDAGSGTTTPEALAVNDLIWWNNVLYRALVTMPIGTALVIGSNIVETNIADEIKRYDVREALQEETAAREEADRTLSEAILDEAEARGEADTALSEAIQDETNARVEADNSLDRRLSAVEGSASSLPDKMYYATPVLRPEIPAGHTAQGGTPFKVGDNIYYALPVIDGSNYTAEVWIYDCATAQKIGTVSGTFYHASSITAEGSLLYVTAGGYAGIVNVIDASTPSAPFIKEVINLEASTQTVFDYGLYKDGRYFFTPSLYDGEYIYFRDATSGVISRSNIKIPDDIKGIRQATAYDFASDTFVMITAEEAGIYYFNESGIVHTISLNGQLALIPLVETEGIALMDNEIWLNSTPWSYYWDTDITPGAVWKYDGNNIDLARTIFNRGDTVVNIDPTVNTTGLTNCDMTGRTTMYPVTFKYLYDIEALAYLDTVTEWVIFLAADFPGSTLSLLGYNQNYRIMFQQHTVGSVYVRGANVSFFNGITQNVANKANWLRTHDNKKCFIFALSGSTVRINEAPPQATDYYIARVDTAGNVVKRSNYPISQFSVSFVTVQDVVTS